MAKIVEEAKKLLTEEKHKKKIWAITKHLSMIEMLENEIRKEREKIKEIEENDIFMECGDSRF